MSKILKPPKITSSDKGFVEVFFPAVAGAVVGGLLAPGTAGIAIGAAVGSALGISKDDEGKKMNKVPVFYSFDFNNDVMRVQQVRNIGVVEGNQATNPNEWEKIKRSGDAAVKNWINENMKYKRCVVVLIGSNTASRPWVQYEIEKAWNDGKALVGIYIHNLKCPRTGLARKGKNPFDNFTFEDGRKLSVVVPCHNPDSGNAYQTISANIAGWINSAIKNKAN